MQRLIDKVVDQLSIEQTAKIPTADSCFKAVLDKSYGVSWDVSFFDEDIPVGYAVVFKLNNGFYQLQNSADIWYRHKDMQDGLGWGVEVNPTYRKRNIGHALLSTVVGLALKDFSIDDSLPEFELHARGMGDKEDFYRKFGFDIKSDEMGEGLPPFISGKYTCHVVPDISIKD